MSSSLQIKPLLEDTVREYSRIKAAFENAASLNQFSGDPTLIRGVEAILEKLRRIREEVARFQESLPPPSEDFTQTYHPPEEHASTGSSGAAAAAASANWVPLPDSQCYCIHCGNPVTVGSLSETHHVCCPICQKRFVCPPAASGKPIYEPAPGFLPQRLLRGICFVSSRHSDALLITFSLMAFVFNLVSKSGFGFIKVGSSVTGRLIGYFAIVGFLLPLLTWRRRILVCPTCQNPGVVTPFLLSWPEPVHCTRCNELFPLPKTWFVYRTLRFFFVLIPFYVLFALTGKTCCTVLAFVAVNFLVSYVIQNTFCRSR